MSPIHSHPVMDTTHFLLSTIDLMLDIWLMRYIDYVILAVVTADCQIFKFQLFSIAFPLHIAT